MQPSYVIRMSKGEDFTDAAAEHFYTYGYAQYKFGNVQQATHVFRLLCMRRPFESRFWFGLGAAYQELKQYEPALKAWAMAAITQQTDPYPHFHAAECALSLHQLKDAKLALQETERRIANDQDHPLRERTHALKVTWNL
jgi:type III secretion system low calcium response chaperone LcrH/SycD